MLKISIVTPSLNQGQFLEDAITSVLSQGYPDLEYVTVDGGSSDSSPDIIRKYADRFTRWIIEPDKGFCDALNKGFKYTTGEIMGWINSDDKYLPQAFNTVSEIFTANPDIEWLTSESRYSIDERGADIGRGLFLNFGAKRFNSGFYLPDINALPQESTFWRRSLWARAGGYIDASLPMVPDFELWSRFAKSADLYSIRAPLGQVRMHKGSMTVYMFDTCCSKAREVFIGSGGHSPRGAEKFFQNFLILKKIPILTYAFLDHKRRLLKYDSGASCWHPWRETIKLFNPARIIKALRRKCSLFLLSLSLLRAI